MSGKTKFLTIIIIALLLMNAGTVTYMFMRGGFHRDGNPREITRWLGTELNFDRQQMEQLKALQEEHRANMDPIHKADRGLHDRYFNLLNGAILDSTLVRQIADSIALNRVQTELVTFYDFRKIRAICNARQQKKFDEIIGEALRMMGRQGPPPAKE